ncbi:hypothetical protein [Herpetosiphon llansteffanensis]|uniref:hypothetical protein n=1 Tax=Herpetosiphon llansteffanensis TaxID=2094568 RepID=UPI000D7C568D|nr:hypothetical protein [Herpetosiphon llansteffanensis]
MNDTILDLNIEHIGRLIAKRTFIWQMGFLKPSDIAKFSKDRSVSFWDDHITKLWQLGLIRADLIRSNQDLSLYNLKLVNNENDEFIYIDSRVLEKSDIDWTSAIRNLPKISSNIEILFHPFRYYVLYHLEQSMKLNIAPIQMLGSKSYPKLLDYFISRFIDWTNKDDFFYTINRWNNIASLAIVAEPFAFHKIFRTSSYSVRYSYNQFHREVQNHWDEAKVTYERINLEELQQLHQQICVKVESIDSNVKIHNIIRLSGNDALRLKTLDKLGGALCIRNMAEIIRRGGEDIYNIELLEEDDARYGPYSKEVKITRYGSGRLFDNNRKVISEYLKQARLDYGVRLRWYVEGKTEYAALKKLVNIYDISDIEIRNLGGRFIEKNSLAFRESLEQDMDSRIFSFISLDGDRSDNLRVVSNAAKDELFLGFFFVSKPDFEVANFNIIELAEVLWSMVPELHNDLDMKNSLIEIVSDSTNAKEFFDKALSISNQFRVGKGEAWGEKLMEYAIEHPTLNGKKRQILESFDISFTAEHDRFMHTKESCVIDHISGKIVKRKESE